MAIEKDQTLTTANSARYNPNSGVFSAGNICVEAGDRIWFVSMQFATPGSGNDVTKDASGYFPHFVYRPIELFVQDPRDAISINKPLYGVHGFGPPKTLRFDLASFYCPWAGEVSIEGGDGPVGENGDLLIQYIWDRSPQQRLSWWQTLVEIVATGLGFGNGSQNPLSRLPRIPVEMRSLTRQTLTFYNVTPTDTSDGTIPARVQRPSGARGVWTPDAQTLTADFGFGTTSAVLESRHAQPIPLGPFLYVTTGIVLGSLVFEIEY